MPLAVPVLAGRAALLDSVDAFVRAAGGVDEELLLGSSLCDGWTRLDVVVHVLNGWQELLGGLACRTGARPTVDASTYWTAFTAAGAGKDRVAGLMAQRRRATAYARPSSAVAHLRDVAEVLRRAAAIGEEPRAFQGEVLTTGDLLTTWAVEDVVHLLDMDCDEVPPASALALARSTVEALAGGPLPTDDDVEAVLVGSGRSPVPGSWRDLALRLPALR